MNKHFRSTQITHYGLPLLLLEVEDGFVPLEGQYGMARPPYKLRIIAGEAQIIPISIDDSDASPRELYELGKLTRSNWEPIAVMLQSALQLCADHGFDPLRTFFLQPSRY